MSPVARKNSSLLHLGKTHWNGRVFLQTCINGSSELMTNLSSSIVNSLYNIQLMKFAGENGVAAYGTMMYINLFSWLSFLVILSEAHRLSVIITVQETAMN